MCVSLIELAAGVIADAIVTLSVPGVVVNVTFDPATSVSVSVFASATTFDCPETAIVVNAFWLTSAPDGACAACECVYAVL